MNRSHSEASAFTESALLEIIESIKTCVTPDDFFSRVDAILADAGNRLVLPIDYGVPDQLKVEGTRAVDIDNAPHVHDYLGEMDRANASDPRLWSYLAVATYREYMEKRWPLKVSSTDKEAWKRRVRDRWILQPGSITRSKLVRHGIGRLWWISHLTYEPGGDEGIARDDKYAYTREVMKSEDRINAIFDREVGAYPEIRRAVLDHAAALGEKATDKYVQKIMQYLTLVHGYRDVGVLDRQQVGQLVGMAAQRID